MKSVLAVVSILYLASITEGLAQATRIQSGSHQNFDRLVFPYPPNATWEVEQNDANTRIVLDPAVEQLDTSQVFAMIERQRILDVIAEPGALVMTLGCACDIDVFRHQGSFLVIDVKDPSEGIANTNEQNQTASTLPSKLPLVFDTNPRTPFSHLSNILEGDSGANRPLGEQEHSFQRTLVTGLTRGLAQGLLSPRPIITPPKTEPTPTTNVSRMVQPQPKRPEPSPSAQSQLRVKSSMDGRVREDAKAEAEFCNLPFDLSLDRFPPELKPTEILQKVQLDLSKINDLPSPNSAVVSAALNYLFLGFGAEARATLQSHDISDPYIEAISLIVDGAVIGPNSVFSEAYECSTDNLLWAILSQGTLPNKADINERALIKAVLNLPTPLKKAVGENILRRLSSDRYEDLYARLETILDVKSKEPLVGRDNTNVGGNVFSAAPPQEKLAIKSSNAHIFVIAQLEEAITSRSAAPESIRDHAASLVDIIPSSEDRAQLRRSLILADILADHLPRALRQLSTAQKENELSSEFWEQLTNIAVENLRPAQFVIIAQVINNQALSIEKDSLKPVIDRLEEIGVGMHGSIQQENKPDKVRNFNTADEDDKAPSRAMYALNMTKLRYPSDSTSKNDDPDLSWFPSEKNNQLERNELNNQSIGPKIDENENKNDMENASDLLERSKQSRRILSERISQYFTPR